MINLNLKIHLTEDKKQSLEELDKIGKERIQWIEELSREAKEQELDEVINSEIARLSEEEKLRTKKVNELNELIQINEVHLEQKKNRVEELELLEQERKRKR